MATLAVMEAEGQNQHNTNQPGFGLPAFSSMSCAIQKAVRPLIWTAQTLNRPSGTQFGESSSHADSKARPF